LILEESRIVFIFNKFTNKPLFFDTVTQNENTKYDGKAF